MDINIIEFKKYVEKHGRKSYVGYDTHYTIDNGEYSVDCIRDKKRRYYYYIKG